MLGRKKKKDPGFLCLDKLLESLVEKGGFLGAVVVPSGSTALIGTFYEDGSRAVLESTGTHWDYAKDERAADQDFDDAFRELVRARGAYSGRMGG